MKKLTILGALKLKPEVVVRQSESAFAFSVSKVKRNIDEILENTMVNSFDTASSDPTEITELGRLLSKIPIEPKCAKMIVVAAKYDLMHYAIMIVACMSVQEIFDDSKFRPSKNVAQNAADDESSASSESDKDLETQIDRDRKEAQIKR